MAETTFKASLAGITASKFGTGEAAIITSPADEKFEYKHVQTDGATVITTIAAETVPVGKIMFVKYRLNGGHYPEGSFSIHVKYKYNGAEKMAVGSGTDGAVLNHRLVKRHRGWVVGRVNAQGAMSRDPKPHLWSSDNESLIAERITIEITHSDDLDIAYFITDHKDINLMPTVREYGDEYYMLQKTEFGQYEPDQWRKIKDTNDGGITVLESECSRWGEYVAPSAYPPEYPSDPEPVYYTVSFDLCGHGSEIKAQTVRGGKKATMPPTPSTEEYRFVAWYTDPEYKTEFDFESPVTSDLTLYAKWSEYEVLSRLSEIARGVPELYNAGIEEGKKAEYDGFWDTFQQNGTRKYYDAAFRVNVTGNNATWNKDNFKPKYDIKPTGTDSAVSMFENFGTHYNPLNMVTHLESLGITIDTSKAKGSFKQAFRGDGVTRWGTLDFSQATNVEYAVYGNGSIKLRRVDMIISGLNTPWHSTTFQNQRGITYMRFGGEVGQSIYFQHQIELDKESFYSIVGVLSDDASGKSITLSKDGVNKAFETSKGANDGATSAEWIALRETKSNWTFTLS